MPRVRRFEPQDIPAVAGLHRRVFLPDQEPTPELQQKYQQYFQDVFLDHPWPEERIHSLVYEEEKGKIGGFLGVVPRPVRLCDGAFLAAWSSQFMVDPASRNRLAAVLLLKAFLGGPQDLSLADESNRASSRIWESLGATVCWLQCIHWTCVLRPACFLNWRLGQRELLRPMARLAGPLCGALDSALLRLPRRPGPPPAPPSLQAEPASPESLLECAGALWDNGRLRPQYELRSLRWLMNRASFPGSGGSLHGVVLRNGGAEIAGWYLYYLSRGRLGEVLQMGARRASAGDVLEHLCHHAFQQGASALRGRLEHSFLGDLLEHKGFQLGPRFWMLVHSRHQALLEATHRGEQALSRLDGEWSLRFQMEPRH